MGLAASQARLISLQARMSDLEYEGQQINQQRQTLTNKMNEVYSAAMDMEVPTAPSKIDFATEAYTGKLGSSTIKLKANDDGSWSGYRVMAAQTCNPSRMSYEVTGLADNKALPTDIYESVSGLDHENLLNAIGSGNVFVQDASGNIVSFDKDAMYNAKDGLLIDGYKVVKRNTEKEFKIGGHDIMSIAEAQAQFGGDSFTTALDGLKRYVAQQHKADSEVPEYKESDYRVFKDDNGGFRFVAVAQLKTSDPEILTPDRDEKAEVEVKVKERRYDTNGNLEKIIIEYEENGKTIEKPIEVNKSTDSYDEVAYDKAFRQYERDKVEYDKAQNDFNHQTSIYQRQDKQLELKLTRLDNERNALNTEIDSVKKVIQDASEKGFKTFSG